MAKAVAKQKSGLNPYTDEERAEIIAHVLVNVASGRFVSRVFREDAQTASGVQLPAVSTFWLWALEDDNRPENERIGISDKLVRARESGVEALLDETIDIADETANDTLIDEEGNRRANSEWITRSRLRVETRLKLAAMLKPRKYGAKVDVTSGGEKINTIDAIAAARQRVIEGMKRVNQQGDEE